MQAAMQVTTRRCTATFSPTATSDGQVELRHSDVLTDSVGCFIVNVKIPGGNEYSVSITERRIASGHPKCMFVLYRESDLLLVHLAFSTSARSHENSTHRGCVASKAPAACEGPIPTSQDFRR